MAMDLAAMNGYYDVVMWLHNVENGPGCTYQAMDAAAVQGHLKVLQFLNENRSEGCSWTSMAVKKAALNGYSKVVEYLLSHRQERYTTKKDFSPGHFNEYSHRAAEEKDYLGVIKCLHCRGIPYIDQEIIFGAIKTNPLPTLEYICLHKVSGITKSILDKVIENGDELAIRYALEAILQTNGKPISLLDSDGVVVPWIPQDDELAINSNERDGKWESSRAMDIAAVHGNLNAVILLHRSGIRCCSTMVISMASANGRVDIAEWLYEHRYEGCSNSAMTFAATRGHLRMIKWLHEVAGLNCTQEALSAAASNGNGEVVAYLLSIPMTENPTSDRVGLFSTAGVHVKHLIQAGDLLDFFLLRGDAVDRAAEYGHNDIIILLNKFDATTNAMDKAAVNGHLDTIKLLHTTRKEGCTIEAIKNAVKGNRLDILKYLLENKCCQANVDYEELCIQAAGCKSIEIFQFCLCQLHTDLSPKLQQRMMLNAAARGLIDNVKWLLEHKKAGWTLKIRDEAMLRYQNKIVKYLDLIGDPEPSVLTDQDYFSYLLDLEIT